MSNDSWNQFKQIVQRLLDHIENMKVQNGSVEKHSEISGYENLNHTFLSKLSNDEQAIPIPSSKKRTDPDEASVAEFYRKALDQIRKEIERYSGTNIEFNDQLKKTSQWLSDQEKPFDSDDLAEEIWSIFFPEGVGLKKEVNGAAENLRTKRTVTSVTPNPNPIKSPAREVLFTSNILITIPSDKTDLRSLDYDDSLTKVVKMAVRDKQLYWYDHPIPIGIKSEKNEILYGLKGLDDAVAFEKKRENLNTDEKITCVFSASVTHDRLHKIAKSYIEEELHKSGRLENINLYVFTETETQRLINEVLVPAVGHLLQMSEEESSGLLQILGVDGMYGRHYSFLKAINAFWSIFIDPDKRATFKIDLDQVFPQEVLVEETGKSAFEHLRSPLWGADGKDHKGNPVHFGMIAGALVNEKDIAKGLFTPDVAIPTNQPNDDEYVFYSKLPQAVSTQSEMMTRYGDESLNGKEQCLERIHVTGGTNGIMVNSLFKYRPFTPSFFGRAEDQAYILSTYQGQETRLAYLHQSGLIMRHDKEAFAQEAMEAAAVGKLIGDYIRILLFSAYAGIISEKPGSVKELLDPFTGCFISNIPTTVVYLRFALKAAKLFSEGNLSEVEEFIRLGIRRIRETLHFVENDIEESAKREKAGWELYYTILEKSKTAIESNDPLVMQLKKQANNIIQDCHIKTGS